LYETLEVLVKKLQNLLGKNRWEPKRHGHDAMLTALKEEYDDLRKRLDTTIMEMSTLTIPFGKRTMQMPRRPLDFMEGLAAVRGLQEVIFILSKMVTTSTNDYVGLS
jgi:hypothetical protein